jgi:hypothetical protein
LPVLLALVTQWMALIFYLSSRPTLPEVQREVGGDRKSVV